jgi:TonB family protein
MLLSPFRWLCSFAGLAVFGLFAVVGSAQNGPPPGSTSTSSTTSLEGGAMAAPHSGSGDAGRVVAATPSAAAVPEVADPKAAVAAIISMFTPNDLVSVPGVGKPLAMTGTWGAQTRFPSGVPHACALARVPCIKVIYNVPEDKIMCEWLIGYLVAVETQPDGSIKHAVHQVVLDENDAAARYTVRKAWSRGESRPKPVFSKAPVYPAIAQAAGIEGVVQVRMVVGPDGSVISAAPIGGPKMLQETTVEAVRQWKFDPPVIGAQPTSYRIDQYFTYNHGRPDFSSDMDPSGKVMNQNSDPHFAPGFSSSGAASGQWESCTAATGCVNAAPPTPQ